jgi:hypothetical protein
MGWIESFQNLLQAAMSLPAHQATLRENEQLKQKVEALERENVELRAQIPQTKEAVLSGDTKRVLLHIFRATQAQDVDTMATALIMERDSLQHHLERLLQSGLAGNFYRKRNTYWVLTSKGRRRVVERAS